VRGAKFRGKHFKDPDGEADLLIAETALEDVARWLGFVSVGGYLAAIIEEREHIFARSTS
jgi:hypothetical protein